MITAKKTPPFLKGDVMGFLSICFLFIGMAGVPPAGIDMTPALPSTPAPERGNVPVWTLYNQQGGYGNSL